MITFASSLALSASTVLIILEGIALIVLALVLLVHINTKHKNARKSSSNVASSEQNTKPAVKQGDADALQSAHCADESKQLCSLEKDTILSERRATAEIKRAEAMERQLVALKAMAQLSSDFAPNVSSVAESAEHAESVAPIAEDKQDTASTAIEESQPDLSEIAADVAEDVSELDDYVAKNEPTPQATASVSETEYVEDDTQEEQVVSVTVNDDSTLTKIIVRRKFSFEGKLRNSEDSIKGYYERIYNQILSYKKTKNRTSFTCDTYRLGMPTVAKITVKGKTLFVYLALNPADYDQKKLHFADVSKQKKYVDTPLMMRVRSDRAFKYTQALVTDVMNKFEGEIDHKYVYNDITKQFGAKSKRQLIDEGLMKEDYYSEVFTADGERISSQHIDRE